MSKGRLQRGGKTKPQTSALSYQLLSGHPGARAPVPTSSHPRPDGVSSPTSALPQSRRFSLLYWKTSHQIGTGPKETIELNQQDLLCGEAHDIDADLPLSPHKTAPEQRCSGAARGVPTGALCSQLDPRGQLNGVPSPRVRHCSLKHFPLYSVGRERPLQRPLSELP